MLGETPDQNPLKKFMLGEAPDQRVPTWQTSSEPDLGLKIKISVSEVHRKTDSLKR